MKTENRGGARAGAGAKKTRTADRVAITMRLETEIADKFNRIRRANGLSQAGQLSEWVDNEGDEALSENRNLRAILDGIKKEVYGKDYENWEDSSIVTTIEHF